MKKKNEAFDCGNCGHHVPPHPTSSRDHCNECLHSRHVDVTPGDRKNTCRGELTPIGLIRGGDKEQILYKCESCNDLVRNIVAPDDNREKLIELSTNPIPYELLSSKTIERKPKGSRRRAA